MLKPYNRTIQFVSYFEYFRKKRFEKSGGKFWDRAPNTKITG